MNRIVLICCFFLIGVVANGQNTKKEKIIKKVSDLTCNCIEKAKTDTIKTEAGYNAVLVNCMTPAMINNLDDLMTAFEFRNFDSESGEKIGYEIGLYLVAHCPKFMELTMRVKKDEIQNEIKQEISNDQRFKSGVSTGTLLRTEQNSLLTFVVKESDGSEVRVWWIDKFEGDAAFLINADAGNGKQVTIAWNEKEIYLPAEKKYIKVKAVTKMTLLS